MLPVERRIYKIIVLKLKLQKRHENSKLSKRIVYADRLITRTQVAKIK